MRHEQRAGTGCQRDQHRVHPEPSGQRSKDACGGDRGDRDRAQRDVQDRGDQIELTSAAPAGTEEFTRAVLDTLQ
ncbi:hypothetical protein [Amycolatopsis aidingensis]|uniref:hypothetical protein n=1 Tax=Amycolatopsis aidingensis TaxID=2842453 RepID=UPI001E48AFCA|nr:hypothetical protein [Amycolatopsis aidingensis]